MNDNAPSQRRDVLRIRILNDEFRRTLAGGRVMMTAGVRALPAEAIVEVLRQVVLFKDFTDANNPHGEQDFGAFEVAGQLINFKIDYYDTSLKFGSPNPADPKVTTRVLTIMLAREY